MGNDLQIVTIFSSGSGTAFVPRGITTFSTYFNGNMSYSNAYVFNSTIRSLHSSVRTVYLMRCSEFKIYRTKTQSLNRSISEYPFRQTLTAVLNAESLLSSSLALKIWNVQAQSRGNRSQKYCNTAEIALFDEENLQKKVTSDDSVVNEWNAFVSKCVNILYTMSLTIGSIILLMAGISWKWEQYSKYVGF